MKLNKRIEHLKHDYAVVAYATNMDRFYKGKPEVSAFRANVETLLDMARWNLTRLACKVKGHDPEDQGFATPEHGCIDMCCRRCGERLGPTTWLY